MRLCDRWDTSWVLTKGVRKAHSLMVWRGVIGTLPWPREQKCLLHLLRGLPPWL